MGIWQKLPSVSEKSLGRNVTFALKALASGSLQVTLTELPEKKTKNFPSYKPHSSPYYCLEAVLCCLIHCLSHRLTGMRALRDRSGPVRPEEHQCERPAAFSPFSISRAGAKSLKGAKKKKKPTLSFLVNTPPITSPVAAVVWFPLPLVPQTYPTSKLHQFKCLNIAWICPHVCTSTVTSTVHLTWTSTINLFCLWGSPVSLYVYIWISFPLLCLGLTGIP